MFTNQYIADSKKKCGVYEVRGTIYSNKFQALSQCKNGEWPRFIFNDDVYSAYDFSQQPQEDLYELYKRRALKLRQKYDNVLIYFSGGIDSVVVIRTFLENNIKIDGVIVTGAWKVDNKLSGTENYNTIEQRNVAIPLLKSMEKEYNVKLNIKLIDIVDSYYHYKDENYVWSLGGNLVGPRMYAWNHIWKDPWVQKFLMKGKTCGVKGIDKPRVFIENGIWKFGFLDSLILDGTPSGELSATQDWDIQEYFFWSPDVPEIVIKQAHVIVDYFEKHLTIEQLKQMAVKDASVDRQKFNRYADPLIYGKYLKQTIGGNKTYFSLPKPLSPGLIQKDLWFHQLSDDETKKQFNVWLAGINLLQKKIDKKYFNSANNILKNKSEEEFTKRYNKIKNEYRIHGMIQPNSSTDNHVIFGTVGCWSNLYDIKKSKFNLDD